MDNTYEKNSEKLIVKIVITGGPCAGKTSGMKRIKETFIQKGYSVVFIPETATELISGGVTPWSLESNLDYQLCQMKLQMAKEEIFEEGANKISDSNKILIVCDRGMNDNKAYMTKTQFKSALSVLGISENELLKRYDAVFHLVTAANGAEEFYTLSNNPARTETIRDAINLDNKLISVWENHPYFKIIGNSDGFDEKMERLIDEISDFLKDK